MGEFAASKLKRDFDRRFVARGSSVRPAAKYASVTPVWTAIFQAGSPLDSARAVATASTAHSPMSSSTATPSTRRAKRVCRILRSKKIREITGMEVTATAMLITSNKDARFDFAPINHASGKSDERS